MNFRKTEYRLKKPKHIFKDIKYSTQNIIKKNPKKLIPNLSCRNFFHKSHKQPIFLNTTNQFDFDKLLLKKSSSNLFQSNDVDLVRNLNFDYLEQINDNTLLRENLISNSLQNNPKEKEESKIFDFMQEKLKHNENKKDQLELPKLQKIKKSNKYKSYEIIQSHRKQIQNEMGEQIEKELINKIKNLRNNMNEKKIEKNEIFLKIKKIELELDEIYMENYFSKQKYKKQIDDIVKKNLYDRKDEENKNKAQAKLEAKKKKYNKSGNFHMEIFNQNKAETNINNSSNSPNVSNSTNKNNNNLPSTTVNTNIKNEEPRNNFDRMPSLKNMDYSNIKNTSNQNSKKNMSKKSMEIFKINLLQTQRKKEFQNFQSAQKEKKLTLKLELKNLENDLNKIDKELDETRKEEKEIINKLMLFYKELLFKGNQTKKDGIVWIIKSIWYLGENVPLSFMPEFLDLESIEYLFQLAQLQLEIDYFTKKILEMKLALKKDISSKYKNDIIKLNINNNKDNGNKKNLINHKSKIFRDMEKDSEEIELENKKNVYTELVKEFEKKNLQFEITNLPEVNRINKVKKHIEKIKKDIVELKKNEIKRISKCFIENDYEEKYHTNIETVLAALIGIDAKDTEMNKFNLNKKDYLSKLKKIRFFDHEHIRKILSK